MTAPHARVPASTDWGVTRGGQGRWCCTGLPTAYRVRARGTERRFRVIRDHELCEGPHLPIGGCWAGIASGRIVIAIHVDARGARVLWGHQSCLGGYGRYSLFSLVLARGVATLAAAREVERLRLSVQGTGLDSVLVHRC